MADKGSMGRACAACKYQRRKCSAECPLVPYFPPDQPKQFLNAHKLFGVSNILRILKQVNDTQKSDAMKTIIYQANARERDPVYGCFGIIVMLQTQIESLKEELGFVRRQVMLAEQQQYHNSCGQQIQPVEGPESLSHDQPASTPAWIYPNVQGSSYDGQQFYRQTDYDINRPNDVFEYEQTQQVYSESKEGHESRRIDTKDSEFSTSQSTYVAPLTRKETVDHLQKLLHSTYEVYGVLRVANPFSVPFQRSCGRCNYTTYNFGTLKYDIGHCNKCNENTAYTYTHSLKCILTSDNKNNLECILEKDMFNRLLPQLEQITYEDYIRGKVEIVFVIRGLQKEGNYTLDQNNVIINLEENHIPLTDSSSQMTQL
ncbi:hypothetical protein SUGI_0015140 [Cryptomeria japonica]|uniref:LOB domain-containing protein 7 n=1 Tax=Cryptomeria japonica TaxID=3369 RepID=UPI002408D751|nr:LOB domain-containing protein 7 [Cryptomeria japonica]GLJ05276.1 hypothetical protein SUGI_0015140 [Cryptomeria japonica]